MNLIHYILSNYAYYEHTYSDREGGVKIELPFCFLKHYWACIYIPLQCAMLLEYFYKEENAKMPILILLIDNVNK